VVYWPSGKGFQGQARWNTGSLRIALEEEGSMPIIQIKALPQRPGTDIAEASRRISSDLAESMGIPLSQIWVTWETIPPWHYAEGDRSAAIQPEGSHPPFVRVQVFEGRSAEDIEKMLSEISGLVAEHLSIEEGNVFVHYEELISGRVHSGGTVLKKSS
jgi:phenylpyruvate tautomerase PptA (4-oxalocrotonate tautomerase family)